MARTHRIHINVFSVVQLSLREQIMGGFLHHKRSSTSSLSGKKTMNTSILYAVHLSLKQQYLGEILHPKKKKFTLIFDWQEYIRTHRCLFCSSSLSEITDYKWICAPQKKTIGHFWHHKKRKSPSSFSGRNALNSHWYISLQFISLWHNRLQVNSCNIQKMNFTVIFQWQEYISVNLRTISMIEKNKNKNPSCTDRQSVSVWKTSSCMYEEMTYTPN